MNISKFAGLSAITFWQFGQSLNMSEKQKTDWRGMAARMRGDLDRADLTGRARRLAEFAIKATLMAGRVRVVIPNRMALCRLLQIGKNHVAEVSASLESSQILKVTESADGWELLVFPDSSKWSVDWTYSREAMSAFLVEINNAPGQCQGELLERVNLSQTLAEVSAQNALRGATSSQNGNQPSAAVPETGTARPLFKQLEVKPSNLSKPYSFEGLKGALAAIEGRDENRAMDGCRQILTEPVMLNDGGKWRNRWRINHGKVNRVFAAAVEDIKAAKVRHIGAHAEWLWKNFAQ